MFLVKYVSLQLPVRINYRSFGFPLCREIVFPTLQVSGLQNPDTTLLAVANRLLRLLRSARNDMVFDIWILDLI